MWTTQSLVVQYSDILRTSYLLIRVVQFRILLQRQRWIFTLLKCCRIVGYVPKFIPLAEWLWFDRMPVHVGFVVEKVAPGQIFQVCPVSITPPKRLRWSRGSVLAFGTQLRGFKPGRSRRIFQGEKFLSTPSFGREVKPFVPCRRFTACKRSLNVTWKSGIFRQNSSAISRPSSSSFHY